MYRILEFKVNFFFKVPTFNSNTGVSIVSAPWSLKISVMFLKTLKKVILFEKKVKKNLSKSRVRKNEALSKNAFT